ncbi:YfhO family protein [Streptomyces sp. NPDC086787]|uniref:YfhO family protein n=1 Tax=Streptomyces sp. NPDC086787 TaxID=3365759 RepID=UPI003824550F
MAFCAGDAAARSYPFGPRTRDINDLGNQYVPFHAHLWDLLHGRADGGLLINWQSGFGAGFLPDLGTYLGSPFALLVAVFPRDEIDLAVYAITVLKTACAAAAMAWLLLTLRPGRWWAGGLLGASYALCGWSVAMASVNPMWLDGLIALPLLCLTGEWAISGRRPVAGALVVAVAWIANFYTAYMATLGAGLVLLLRLLLSDLTRGRRLAAAGRAGLTTTLGIGLAAPLVTVVYFGTKHAYPGRAWPFAPVGTDDLLARLLPTTYSYASPAVYVGTAALLLALALPFHRAVPRSVRAGWTLLVAAVLLSMQWQPTHLLWHAFATPQGSPYRQAFVLCGLLVTAAWTSVSYGPPDLRALAAAAGLFALLAALASGSLLTHRPLTVLVTLFAAAAALAGLALLARAGGARRAAPVWLAVALLLGGQFGEAAANSAVAARQRYGHMDHYAPWGPRQQRQSELIADADGWPRYRTDPGREQTVGNDPLEVGGQGAQYYSSLTSDVLSRLLTALGGGWTSRARNLQSLDNAVTDVIFSVGARLHSPPDPHQNRYPQDGSVTSVTRRDVPPLVTVRPAGTAAAGLTGVSAFGRSPYRNQELVLGAQVYTVPSLTVRTAEGTTPHRAAARRAGVRLAALRAGTGVPGPTITAACPAGNEVYLWAPYFSGTARLAEAPADAPTGRFHYDRQVNKIAAMEPLGRVPASGRLRVYLAPDTASIVPDEAVGCLDTVRLRTAAARLKTTGAVRVSVSDGTIHARFPTGTRGTAVVAVPRIAGWRCAAGDARAAPAAQFYGLVAVPLDGATTRVTCTFHPPGLRLGAAVGGASLLALTLLGVVPVVRRRRTPAPAPTARPRDRATT